MTMIVAPTRVSASVAPRRSEGCPGIVRGFVVVAAAGALLAACGEDSTDSGATTPASSTSASPATSPATTPTNPGTSTPASNASEGIEHPREKDRVVIRVDIQGGLVPPGADFAELPLLIIAGDGAVYRGGVTTEEFPGPLVRPVGVRQLTEAGIQRLLALADEAELLAPPPDYSGATNVADGPDTIVTINAAGGMFVHRAYALGIEGDQQSSPAREVLYGFVERLGDLDATVGDDQLGDEAFFTPAAYRIRAFRVEEADADAMDPTPARVSWPDSAGIMLSDATECATLDAAVIGALFAESKENTLFTEGDGETASLYRLAVAPVLPGDAGC
jgi:hypothetical protein